MKKHGLLMAKPVATSHHYGEQDFLQAGKLARPDPPVWVLHGLSLLFGQVW